MRRSNLFSKKHKRKGRTGRRRRRMLRKMGGLVRGKLVRRKGRKGSLGIRSRRRSSVSECPTDTMLLLIFVCL
jgi:hypothetical protein